MFLTADFPSRSHAPAWEPEEKLSNKEQDKRAIDKKFDEFIDWVEDTMTTEDNPFIQVVAVLKG